MTVLRVCYKHGVPFDEGYYVSKHLPLVASVYGPLGLRKVEVVKVSGSANGLAPPYAVIFSAYFDSSAATHFGTKLQDVGRALQSAMQSPRAGDVRADIANYYGGAPDVMIGEVVAVPS